MTRLGVVLLGCAGLASCSDDPDVRVIEHHDTRPAPVMLTQGAAVMRCTLGASQCTDAGRCTGDSFCSVNGATCTGAPCVAGTTQCNDGWQERCRDDRTAWERTGQAC